ncbi:hypothetical protein AURDEDRAFT_116756 [Auricularia subglabra TFB-10046 SS5]|uniref:DUF218 domain-containing protein n=1 Tax=Auricularia subglabra (strain TFB-10046 / SS5) TaxID=717982 RepID=J0CZW4_AURST|nr:hypothetical protein AURDEDRAFT_116756 [Auricularia subglabra TFB-10046 SS5]
MLPVPASFIQRGGHYTRLRSSSIPLDASSWRKTLFTRSRATNLAVALGTLLCVLSLLLNAQLWLASQDADIARAANAGAVVGGYPPLSILSTLNPRLRNLDHLIVVAGHAIWHGCSPEERMHEDDWILEPIQREQKLLSTFFKHISKGAELSLSDPKSLLVFSGGQTRSTSLETEGASYLRLAHDAKLFGRDYNESAPFPRATSEQFALDSFQNVLFSIGRFHEVTGSYPSRITVVSFGAKRARFVELHSQALRWRADRFNYVGIDPADKAAAAMFQGEKQFGYAPYSKDLYGCHGELLAKRRKRNPFHRFHSYYTSSPELAGLLDYCPGHLDGGQTHIYPGALPWDSP